MAATNRPLRVFLCHSSADKPAVRGLYQKLCAESWLHPWLDEEQLYPGQDWNLEIEKAIESTDVIIVCLSSNSITKEGYVQREIRIALDYADYKPEGTLFIIPVRLEECEPPRRLRMWQYADYFENQRERGLNRLLVSLKIRADSLGLEHPEPALKMARKPVKEGKSLQVSTPKIMPLPDEISLPNGMKFMHVLAGKFMMGNDDGTSEERPQHTVDIPYDYWMGYFPVTNEQYNQFQKKDFGKGKGDHPVVYIKWIDAQNYVEWLNEKYASQLPKGYIFCLPSEAEWEKAARGEKGLIYPWGNDFDSAKCNTREGGKGGTTPLGLYSPGGDSPYGCADMAGNVWEWTRSVLMPYPYKENDGREGEHTSGVHVSRGGSWVNRRARASCSSRNGEGPGGFDLGFRLACSPSFKAS